jgi:hypothetical protein
LGELEEVMLCLGVTECNEMDRDDLTHELETTHDLESQEIKNAS